LQARESVPYTRNTRVAFNLSIFDGGGGPPRALRVELKASEGRRARGSAVRGTGAGDARNVEGVLSRLGVLMRKYDWKEACNRGDGSRRTHASALDAAGRPLLLCGASVALRCVLYARPLRRIPT